MKKHYFFVTADFKFRKKYVNTQYDSHPTDVWRFDQKETYMIEQKDETDEIFFPALKSILPMLWMHMRIRGLLKVIQKYRKIVGGNGQKTVLA